MPKLEPELRIPCLPQDLREGVRNRAREHVLDGREQLLVHALEGLLEDRVDLLSEALELTLEGDGAGEGLATGISLPSVALIVPGVMFTVVKKPVVPSSRTRSAVLELFVIVTSLVTESYDAVTPAAEPLMFAITSSIPSVVMSTAMETPLMSSFPS